MRQKDRPKCLDAGVMRGAECHTDHQLLVLRVKVMGKGFHRKTPSRTGRFDVSKLSKTGSGEELTPREVFQEETVSEICAAWLHDGSVEEKWSVVKQCGRVSSGF